MEWSDSPGRRLMDGVPPPPPLPPREDAVADPVNLTPGPGQGPDEPIHAGHGNGGQGNLGMEELVDGPLPTQPLAAFARPQQLEYELRQDAGSVNLRQGSDRPEELLGLCRAVVPLEVCLAEPCLPIRVDGDRITLVIPSDMAASRQDSLRHRIRRKGLDVAFQLAPRDELEDAVARLKLYQQSSEVRQIAEDDSLREVAGLVPDGADLEASVNDANAAPVVALADKIMIRALSLGASDIHIEPHEQALVVRLRQDGVLRKTYGDLPRRAVPALISRFKVMADLDIAERRLPQDGRIRRRFRGRVVDFRISTLPSRFGEKICLRLLDNGATQCGLDQLISDPASLASIREMGRRPCGLVLVTGPTGSGKSTTLYSLLAERNDPGINISTVEDPIEYTLPGITQTQVNREKGFDFATALRAFMRQDPDVLLVGETRDLETARTAIEAALTGHLVLTTLHCNDAPSAIARLDEMGMEPFMVSASLIGVISQRLLRRVCPACRETHRPTPAELARVGLLANNTGHLCFYRARQRRQGEPVCPRCDGSGYRGRIGVYEVLRMNEAMASAVAQRASTDRLRQMAIEAGMKSLLGGGLDLVRAGHVTLEEVERVLLTDAGLASERRARALSCLSCSGCGAGLQDHWLECPYCLTVREL